MNLLNIDTDRCTRDFLCANDCPACIINPDENGFPAVLEESATRCIECGHCVAVCPQKALSHRTMAAQDCPPIRSEWMLEPEQAEQFLRSRRSIRQYKSIPVGKDRLTNLIRLARYAPSGHNRQPARWLVISGRDRLSSLAQHVVDWMHQVQKQSPQIADDLNFANVISDWNAGSDRILRGAPHLFIAFADKDDRTAPAACTLCISYLELAAPVFGLGACWAGYFMACARVWEPLVAALDLPQGSVCQAATMVGIPKVEYHRLPTRQEPAISFRD